MRNRVITGVAAVIESFCGGPETTTGADDPTSWFPASKPSSTTVVGLEGEAP